MMKNKTKIVGISLLLIFSLLLFTDEGLACANPTDSFATEVALNKPSITYDLSGIKQSKDVTVIEKEREESPDDIPEVVYEEVSKPAPITPTEVPTREPSYLQDRPETYGQKFPTELPDKRIEPSFEDYLKTTAIIYRSHHDNDVAVVLAEEEWEGQKYLDVKIQMPTKFVYSSHSELRIKLDNLPPITKEVNQEYFKSLGYEVEGGVQSGRLKSSLIKKNINIAVWSFSNIEEEEYDEEGERREDFSGFSIRVKDQSTLTHELEDEWHFELKDYAERFGLVFFSTMEDRESVDFLIKDLKIPLIKVGSGDLTNYPLLKYTAKFGIPMVLSTGMAMLSEIDEAVRTVLNEGNDNIVLLQCTTQYPCPYEDVNLRAMLGLKEALKTIVGFSDHSLGIECAVAAVALGAKYIEKHFTLDRNLPGPDHKSSLEPEEFKRMVTAIRNTEKALGDGIKRPMSSELKNKRIVTRKIVAARDIKKGEVLNEENVTFKRANEGLTANYYKLIEGKNAKKTIKLDEPINLSEIE
ncbi:MAG TPA: hypothetical protein C5S37_09655 [Methanophagales archaeon]|nr:hypothetical protein [Methanophagales archaeon]